MLHPPNIKEFISPILGKSIKEYSISCPLHYFGFTDFNKHLLQIGYELVHPGGIYFFRGKDEIIYVEKTDNLYILEIYTTLDYTDLQLLFFEAFNDIYKYKYALVEGSSRKIESSLKAPDFDMVKSTSSESVVSILENILWNYEDCCNQLSKSYFSNTLGILLYGPPGYGKTFILRSFLNKLILEKDFTIIQIYQRTLRYMNFIQLFDSCKSLHPCILFIEDLDIGFKDRKGSFTNDNATGQLLETFEGLYQTENMVLIATTNSVGSIEKALLRPGRFDYLIEIEKPSKNAKEMALSKYMEQIDFDIPDTLIENLIAESETFAELKGGFQHIAMTYMSQSEFPKSEEIKKLTDRWKETRKDGVPSGNHRKVGLI